MAPESAGPSASAPPSPQDSLYVFPCNFSMKTPTLLGLGGVSAARPQRAKLAQDVSTSLVVIKRRYREQVPSAALRPGAARLTAHTVLSLSLGAKCCICDRGQTDRGSGVRPTLLGGSLPP